MWPAVGANVSSQDRRSADPEQRQQFFVAQPSRRLVLSDEYESKKAAYRSFVGHYSEARRSLVRAYHLGLEPEAVQGFHTWKPVEVLYRGMINGQRARERKSKYKEQLRLQKEAV